MAGLAVAAAIGVMTLPETHNQPTMENLALDQKDDEEDENPNRKDVDGEKNTLMWIDVSPYYAPINVRPQGGWVEFWPRGFWHFEGRQIQILNPRATNEYQNPALWLTVSVASK